MSLPIGSGVHPIAVKASPGRTPAPGRVEPHFWFQCQGGRRMIDDKIIDLFRTAIKKSRADQTEFVCESEEFYLTRFAENLIHQNMGRSDSTIWCRAIVGKKVGVASSNNPTKEGSIPFLKALWMSPKRVLKTPIFPGLQNRIKPLLERAFSRRVINTRRNRVPMLSPQW